MLAEIKQRYKDWRKRRFLKKHHCDSWEQYNRWYDPDINGRSTQVRYFYYGYPYFYCFENRNHNIYNWNSLENLRCWAETHCQHKYRMDIFRVIKCPATSNEWEINDLGGRDYIFIAFKNEHDAFKFMLKWA